MSEIGRRVEQNGRGQRVLATVAKRHRDAGVDQLCDLLTQPMTKTAKKGQPK
jgi:hypothetical protein